MTFPEPTPVPTSLEQARGRLAGVQSWPGLPEVGLASPRRAAAVLILISAGEAGEEIVLVEKRPDLRNHAGQLAFPGGAIEATDSDPVAAALREAQEEVGVAGAEVDVLGILPSSQIPRSGFDVTPVVGWWTRRAALSVHDPGELSAVHQVRIEDLLDPSNRNMWRLGRFTGPGFRLGDLYVWGFTAHLLDGLFDLLGWTVPWDASQIGSVPDRFLRGEPGR